MGAWGGRWHTLEPWAGGPGGGCEPWSPTGAAAASRGQRPAWGCSCRGWFGCQAPYGDTARFWRLATTFSPYQKEKQPRPFPDLEESLAALSGPRAGFQSGVSPSLPSPGQARAGWRVAASGFGASRKGRNAPRCPGASVGLGASLDELLQSGWSSARAGSPHSLRQRSRACRGGTGEISSPLAARPWARGCSSRQLGAASEASCPRPPSARACVLLLVHPEASAQIFGNLPCVLGLPRVGAGLCPSRAARVTHSVVLFLNSVVTSCASLELRGEGSRSGCERAVRCFTCARSHQTTP